jgi:hypothetical protein
MPSLQLTAKHQESGCVDNKAATNGSIGIVKYVLINTPGRFFAANRQRMGAVTAAVSLGLWMPNP